MTPQEHNKTLGITHLAYGGFHLLLMIFFSLIFLFVMAVPHRGDGGMDIFTIMMLMMFAFSLLFTLPSLIAGYALLKRKSWARTAAIVAGILAAPSFPHGTALGVYTLWFMFGNEGKELYADNARAWGAPARYGALPNANPSGIWSAGETRQERERERVPP
ncbi:MAG TPA: hypothetical protein VEQ40_04040, partial [Pyrinomonadaceae bacterium]|nr:hypothetical protein [Pyrinomonadaceae bacterium]